MILAGILGILTFGWCTPVYASNVNTDVISISTIGGQSSSNGVTFSSYVYLAIGSSLTLQGANGFITTASSINASAFFGNGGHLTGISALANDQTFSGANTFTSSFTVQSGGRQIILSTSATTNNINISPSGAVSFSPELHNSSSTTIPQASTTNQLCGPCVVGSTLTITTTGGRVEIVFTGVVYGNGSTNAAITFLQDGQFVGNLGPDAVVGYTYLSEAAYPTAATRYLINAPSAASHSYCLSLCKNTNDANTTYLSNDTNWTNLFFVKEIK